MRLKMNFLEKEVHQIQGNLDKTMFLKEEI